MSSEAKGGCERRGGQERKSCLTADSGWQHTGWVAALPRGFGFSYVGEVLVFRKKEGFGHALIKAISWAPKVLRERKKGSKVLERYRAGKDPWPRSCVRKRGERKKQKNLSRLWA